MGVKKTVRVLVRYERKHNDGRTKTRTTPSKTVARPCGAREGIVLVSANRRRSGSPIPFGQSSLPRRRRHAPIPPRTALATDTTTDNEENHPPLLPQQQHRRGPLFFRHRRHRCRRHNSQVATTSYYRRRRRATIKIDPGRHTRAREKTPNIYSHTTRSLCIIILYSKRRRAWLDNPRVVCV